MAKFSGSTATVARPLGPTATTGRIASTHEGDYGHEKDPKTALYTLAVANMVGESTFYESAKGRDARFVALAHQVTAADPEWVQAFVPFLRDTANMRSASIVLAAEYVKAGGPNARAVVSAACSRGDEPAELIGYWLATHGRKIPMAVKRGVGDAAKRLYTERNVLKYDGTSRGVRMADVLNLCHPKPDDDTQAVLFGHIIDRRYGRDLTDDRLTVLADAYRLDSLPETERRAAIANPDALANAGYTWERLSGWLPGGMDAAAWEAVIPSMGYMALLRNLRNFEQAGVSADVLAQVDARLSDPEQVARSRQFPYRFFSAWKATGSMRFGQTLETALNHSLANVPILSGRTLVLVDVSGSMDVSLSGRSEALRWEVGALFGGVTANRSTADLVAYGTQAAKLDQVPSALRTVDAIGQLVRSGHLGYGTNTWQSADAAYDGHDRIIVFTDMQDHPGNARVALPDVPIYVWDLSGHATANIEVGRGRYLFGGFNDAAFRLIPLLESGRDASWPWETGGA